MAAESKHEAAAPDEAGAEARDSAVWRVLLVETQAGQAGAIAAALENAGGSRFQVEWAGSLEVAETRIEAGGIDLVLLDPIEPTDPDLPCLRQLRAWFPSTPVVVLVDEDRGGFERLVIQLGALACLRKDKLDPYWLARLLHHGGEHDATERRLRAAMAFYKSVVEQLPHGIFRKDAEGRFTFANPWFCRLVGLSPPELLGRTSSEVFSKEDAQRYLAQDQSVLTTGRPYEGVGPMTTPDGRRLHVHVTKAPITDREDRVVGYQGLLIDVTKRCVAEQALQESQERLALVIDGSNEGIWDWNVVTNEVFFSPRWKSMLGYADHEIKNVFASWEKLLHPDDHERAMATLCGYLSGRQHEYALEHRLRHKDGSYRWILARGVALRGADGHPVRMAGSHVDITERKQAEERLRTYAETLAQSNRDLEDFATVASHDLQEPLGKVEAFAELLEAEDAPGLSDKARDYVRRIHKASRRAQTLVHGLLQYSLVQTAARPFAPVDLDAVARDVLADLDARIQPAGARVSVEPLGQMEGDPVQLQQLLQNLIGNALKFSRPGVPPVIRVRAPRAWEGQAEAGGRREVCHLTVEDNGIGIEERHRDRLFLMFQRINPQQYEGTGVGLAICRRIAQRHGGGITVQSQPGAGSTFVVTLPVRPQFPEPAQAASPPAAAP